MKFKLKNAFLFLSLIGSASVFAQTPQSAQPVKETAQPASQSNFSDAELNQFATVYKELLAENEKVQMDLQATIEKEEMDVQRFSEIQQASVNPDAEVDASKEELEKYAKIMTEVEKVQVEFNEKVEKMIVKNGFTTEQYQAIATALQQDPSLQQKLQELMAN